jgi:DNA repair protein SbcC/Rad50
VRPLSLELGGFTCFREPARVSFDDLSLFAIEGPTGAGKSTLLDAMTYALYGQTPRLGGRGLDILLSPGLSQMYVSFAFEVSNQPYRVARLLEKKGSRIEPQVRIERLVNGDWKQLAESERVREAKERLERIVGLDYDGFTRAVLLPQGAFDEFLRGDLSKRRELLIRLLGLDKVREMQREAGQRARDAETRRVSIETRLEQDYTGATPEGLRALKDELETLRTCEKGLLGRREEVAKELQALAELKGLYDELDKTRAKIEALKRQEAQIAADRKALARARQASLLLPQVETATRAKEKAGRLQGELARQREALAAARRAATGARAELTEAEGAAGRLPEIARQLEALASVKPLLAQLKTRGGDLKLAERAKENVVYSDEAWDSFQAYRAQLPALEKAQGEVREAQKEMTRLEEALAAAEESHVALTKEFEALKKKGLAAKEAFEALEAAYQKAVIADRAAALRPHLHVGEVCMVCEQVVTALPPALKSEVAALEEEKGAAQIKLEGLREEGRAVQSKLKVAEARLEDLRGQLERAKETSARHEAALQDIQKRFAKFGTADPARVKERLEEGRVHLLASLAAQILEQAQGLDPERSPARLSAERDAIEKALAHARQREQEAQAALTGIEAQEGALTERLAEATAELTEAEAGLAGALERAGFGSAEEVRAAALSEARQNSLESGIKGYEMQRASAERREVELESKLAGQPFDLERYDLLTEEKGRLEAELSELQRRQGSVRSELTAFEARIEKAKELRAETRRLAERYDTYRQLSQDLRGDNFPDYLLARVQGRLAWRASQVIREVTEGRYDLRLKDNDFYVLDAWNSGEARSAKTLSGGETFIASLALALALSDTVAGNTSLGALFLDEGFGTLDLETLDAVARVLEALTQQGRLVGVITHVTALSERLPARLRVQKGLTGSTLSWD